MTNRFSSFVLSAPETIDCRTTDEVEVQVTDLSGGDTIAITRSLNGDDFFNQMEAGPLAADGIYLNQGGAYLKFTKTGSASTPTITARQKVNTPVQSLKRAWQYART